MLIKQKNISVILIAFLLVGRTMRHLWRLCVSGNFTTYQKLFNGFLSETEIMVRYTVSIGLRAAIVAAAIGLLFSHNVSRKALVGISWFAILTILWKHPYDILYRSALNIWEHYPIPGKWFMSLDLTQEQLAWVWLFFFNTVEITVCALTIYILTRPSVKSQFK